MQSSLEDELRDLRRQTEELKIQAIREQIKQEKDKLRLLQEKVSFDIETPRYIAAREPSSHTETPRYAASQRDTNPFDIRHTAYTEEHNREYEVLRN